MREILDGNLTHNSFFSSVFMCTFNFFTRYVHTSLHVEYWTYTSGVD